MFWIIKGLHILLAIIWVGGILFIGAGVYPAAKIMKFTEQRAFFLSLMKRSHVLFTLVGIGVIITGILLGTVFGPIKEWHIIWTTRYGLIWLTALLTAIFTLSWGVFVGYKKTIRVLNNESLWKQAESGDLEPLYKALKTTAILESVEVIGFMVLIACMVLFG